MRVGSLNINGGRDRQKREVVSRMITQKKIDVVFLQKTHSDKENEIDWGLWWKGQGLLSPGLDVNIISTTEKVTGSALVVRAETQHMSFVF